MAGFKLNREYYHNFLTFRTPGNKKLIKSFVATKCVLVMERVLTWPIIPLKCHFSPVVCIHSDSVTVYCTNGI